MKHFTLVLTLLSLALSTQSQTTFFKWFPTPEHEVTNDVAQTSHGDYLLVGKKGETTESRMANHTNLDSAFKDRFKPEPD